MKAVVTGATGHLGTDVVAELLGAGYEVVAVSRRGELPAAPFGAPANNHRARALAADVSTDSATVALAAELGPEVALVHLAAWHPPATAATGPADRRRLIDVNVLGTMRALDAARRERGGAAVVVYASSFEVYGEPEDRQVIDESARTAPLTDYGATKLAGEDHLLSFAAEEDIRVLALRMPAIYGPGERTARALPNFLRAAARGERPVIFGDGGDLRDQLHARDAARAVTRCLSSSASGIFNVADGAPHSILELARTALALAGSPEQPERKPREKPRRDYHMSIERARRELGFSPAVDLMTGMREELSWMRAGEPKGAA